jgi:hypothetical protein
MLVGEEWRGPFIDFIRDLVLPTGMDPKSAAAARIMRRSKGFVLVADRLYRCGARSGVLMKCVTTEEAQDILREIHEGVCGNHAASRTLVGKAFELASGGPPPCLTLRTWCDDVRIVSSSASNHMSRLTTLLPYHLPGRLHAGALT